MTPIVQRIFMALVILALCGTAGYAWQASEPQYSEMRSRMVRTQIQARGVNSPQVLQAMLKIERHLFVPEQFRRSAYNDHPLLIGEGQTISQPYIVALMTEMLNLSKSDKVLEIGTGSGYQAAVLGELCDQVYSIEIVESLGIKEKKLLKDLGYANVHVMVGDGYKGWPKHSPFDAVIVTCAPTSIPQPLVDQLADGGRMVIPVGEAQNQALVILTKNNGVVKQEKIIPVRFVPMTKEGGGVY